MCHGRNALVSIGSRRAPPIVLIIATRIRATPPMLPTHRSSIFFPPAILPPHAPSSPDPSCPTARDIIALTGLLCSILGRTLSLPGDRTSALLPAIRCRGLNQSLGKHGPVFISRSLYPTSAPQLRTRPLP